MEVKDILPMAMLILIAIVGVSIGVQVLSGVKNVTSIPTDVTNEQFIGIYDTAVAMEHKPFIANSVSVDNGAGVSLTAGTDFSTDNPAGTITIKAYPRSSNGETFTSLYDTNVSLAHTNINPSSDVVYNCSNPAQTFSDTTDYTLYATAGKIKVLSTGTMANNTQYCINYTYALVANGTTLYADYQYDSNNEIVTKGISGLSQFGNWWTILVTVIVAVIVVGLLTKLYNSRK